MVGVAKIIDARHTLHSQQRTLHGRSNRRVAQRLSGRAFRGRYLGDPGPAHQLTPPSPPNRCSSSTAARAARRGVGQEVAKEAATKALSRGSWNSNAAARLDLQGISSGHHHQHWGDGDPPDNAAAFWSHISTDSAPKLDNLSYSVLALGDRNYRNFAAPERSSTNASRSSCKTDSPAR